MITDIVRPVYDRTIRPFLPRRIAVMNGIPVRKPRLFDFTDVNPRYENELLAGLHEHASPGDEIVIVGGGYGVSAVVAAERVKPDGRVTVYEAAGEQVERIKETLELNQVDYRVSVNHRTVGNAVEVWGEDLGEQLDPGALPEADLYVIDVEGAELSILKSLGPRPPVLLVEYHAIYGAPKDEVAAACKALGYDVTAERPHPMKEGIGVLTAEVV